jgi:hypothetical protein
MTLWIRIRLELKYWICIRISVADPGCFIPDPDPSICSSRIPDLGYQIPDLGS